MINLTEDQFYEQFNIRPNHLTNNESFGGMYETYGEELDYVFNLAKTENRVWTIIEGESGNLYFCSGFHLVNRFGFIITEEEYTEETEVALEGCEEEN